MMMIATMTSNKYQRKPRLFDIRYETSEPVDDSLVFAVIDAIDDRRARSRHSPRTSEEIRYARIFGRIIGLYYKGGGKWISADLIDALQYERIALPLALKICQSLIARYIRRRSDFRQFFDCLLQGEDVIQSGVLIEIGRDVDLVLDLRYHRSAKDIAEHDGTE